MKNQEMTLLGRTWRENEFHRFQSRVFGPRWLNREQKIPSAVRFSFVLVFRAQLCSRATNVNREPDLSHFEESGSKYNQHQVGPLHNTFSFASDFHSD